VKCRFLQVKALIIYIEVTSLHNLGGKLVGGGAFVFAVLFDFVKGDFFSNGWECRPLCWVIVETLSIHITEITIRVSFVLFPLLAVAIAEQVTSSHNLVHATPEGVDI